MENHFMRVEEVAKELDASKSYAYKLIQTLNNELKEKGYITVAGRISKKFFMERMCYDSQKNKGGQE